MCFFPDFQVGFGFPTKSHGFLIGVHGSNGFCDAGECLLGRQRCKPCKKHFRKRMKGGKQMRGTIGLKMISNERYTDRFQH